MAESVCRVESFVYMLSTTIQSASKHGCYVPGMYLREVFRDEKRVSLAAGRFATRSTFVLWRVFR